MVKTPSSSHISAPRENGASPDIPHPSACVDKLSRCRSINLHKHTAIDAFPIKYPVSSVSKLPRRTCSMFQASLQYRGISGGEAVVLAQNRFYSQGVESGFRAVSECRVPSCAFQNTLCLKSSPVRIV